MTQSFTVAAVTHGFLGPMIALALPGQPCRRLTPQEAAILSRALEAVAQGASAEPQIYLSPAASDCDFEARVVSSGLLVALAGYDDVTLGWEEARRLAKALIAEAQPYAPIA